MSVVDARGQDRIARVEGLLEDLDRVGEGPARDVATELVEALLDLYGEGLARIVERIAERDDGTLAAELGRDELVSHLLLLHGLHPVPLEERVRGALGEVRPYLETHGGGVDLLSVDDDGVVRLQLQGSCSGCPSSAVTLKHAVEEAIHKAAPDVADIVSVDAEGPALIQLEVYQACPAPLHQ
jgi:Fe-S cluster biogenesis protein NfuA